ncbi:glycogen debranching enzyme [Lyngbya sp. PCC 8106]|nr:glycogen debranching enzyme [Lyngbya sp. PCC 8106]
MEYGVCESDRCFFNGEEIPEVGYKGEPVMDESFMLFFNAHYEMIEFDLPAGLRDRKWRVVIDTKEPYFINDWVFYTEDKPVPVTERSVVVLQRC